MSAPRYRPKRRLRSELFPLAAIFALIASLYLTFPSGAIGFEAAERKAPANMCNAYVEFAPAREEALLAAARTAWQSEPASRRGMRADLLSCDGDWGVSKITSGLRPSVRESVDAVAEYEGDFLPEGLAAPAPAQLLPDPPQLPPLAFPKSELLKLN